MLWNQKLVINTRLLVHIRLINKETCEYHQCLRKMNLKENFDFQLIYQTKSKCRPFSKYLPTCLMIGDSITLARQIPTLDIHYSSFFCRQKQTWAISFRRKALMTFHHGAPNNYVPGLLEFLVNLSRKKP